MLSDQYCLRGISVQLPLDQQYQSQQAVLYCSTLVGALSAAAWPFLMPSLLQELNVRVLFRTEPVKPAHQEVTVPPVGWIPPKHSLQSAGL